MINRLFKQMDNLDEKKYIMLSFIHDNVIPQDLPPNFRV